MATAKTLVWARNRGRNGWDPVINVGPEESVESINVHLYEGGLGTRRGGTTAITTTGVTNPINAMAEYIPGQDPTASELFVVDGSATTKILRCAGGSSFSNLTLVDNVATSPKVVSFAVLNGKLYLAYDSTVNRLHVFDPGLSTTKVRRAGMGTPAAATVANTGGGAYPATLRYYRVAFTEQRGGVTVRRSLLGASVSFTPSGAGTAARVTKPASLSEDETHWELYGSADNVTYYLLTAAIVVGTTTYDDSAAPSSYSSGTAMPTEGANTPFPSVKFLATDGTRLLGFGVWESTAGDSLAPKNGRVYFGPVQDSSVTPYAVHDDERINNTTTLSGWIDVARNSGAEDRGMTPRAVNGNFYAFQSTGVYAIIPTDSPIVPYRREVVDPDIGCVSQQSIVMAADRLGRPCCYFLDPVKGPMVIGGADGLRWCGKDVNDIWQSYLGGGYYTWGLWYPERQQVWFAIVSSNELAMTVMVLDVTENAPDEHGDLRGGWTQYQYASGTTSRCGVTYASTLASTRPITRVPHLAGIVNGLARYDESVSLDLVSAFVASVTSGALEYDTHDLSVLRSYLMADDNGCTSDNTITQVLRADSSLATTPTSNIVLNSTGAPAQTSAVLKKFEDAQIAGIWALQVYLHDTNTSNPHQFTLREWRGEILEGAAR